MKNNKLRELRLKKGFSQENIAFELGISQKAYSKIENGKVCINNEKLVKIAEILETVPNNLCELSCKCDMNDSISNKIIDYLNKKNIEIPNFLKK
jgi:transcriptional regulator with XRE-family HTH domain